MIMKLRNLMLIGFLLLPLAAHPASLQQENQDDDAEQHHLHESGLRVVPQEELLQDPQAHPRRERPGQARHPPDRGRRQGPQE